jgi:hypothetical protein
MIDFLSAALDTRYSYTSLLICLRHQLSILPFDVEGVTLPVAILFNFEVLSPIPHS